MPKIYEYFGIIFLFHTNDHLPIHVHAKYGSFESKFELVTRNGKVVEIVQKRVAGKLELPPSQVKYAKALVKAKKESIVKKWEQVFVENRPIEIVKINNKL